jgi:NADPH:quinone reductase-like Zn-dependent oxidoreductase
VLTVVERPAPEAGAKQVVVQVTAATVQPADLAARLGLLPGIQPPFSLGWDVAGRVCAIGDGVTDFQVDDRVAGLIFWPAAPHLGAYAEQLALDADVLVPIPDGLDDRVAATVPLNALTARQALDLLALPAESTVLITGASGGVGGFAAQLAVHAGHRVIAVAGRDDEEWVAGLGVAEVLPRSTDLSTIAPVPAVFDAVPVGPGAVPAVQDGGVLVTTRPTPPVDPAKGIRQQVVMVRPDRDQLREVLAEVAAGRLRTRVAQTVPLTEVAEAHRLAEISAHQGKIVLVP